MSRVAKKLVGLRSEREVVRVPPGGERDAGPACRDVVHDGPFLGHPQRVVQRQHHAARADLYPLGDRGDRRGRHGRIRVEPAELVEVALRGPHRGEAVPVGEPRAFQEQAVPLARAAFGVAAEVEQAEADRSCLGRAERSVRRLRERVRKHLQQQQMETAI